MDSHERRFDIDWLRVIAIGLLLVYHIGIGFQPWGVFIRFIQNNEPLEILWIPMTMMNIWRIPLLFFVSGMGVCFAMKKRNWKQLIGERTRRILVPFLFGMFFIVPVHVLIWQKYYHQDLSYSPHTGHLWFLANIYIYVILLSPLLFFMTGKEEAQIDSWLRKFYSTPLGLLIVPVSFILEAQLVKPVSYETYAMNWHGFILGFLAFFFGFGFILSGTPFWKTVSRWKWVYLTVAVIFYLVRYFEYQLNAPGWLMAVESNAWIFALFGFGYTYLNHPGKILAYLSQAAYPVYIIHMVFLYLGSYLIFPLPLPETVKFALVVAFTFSGCFITYEFFIRRIKFLRPLFGLKGKTKNGVKSEVRSKMHFIGKKHIGHDFI